MISDARKALKRATPDSDSGRVTARFVFGSDLPLFSGHFPGDPVLPGVLQVEMVRAVLDAATGSHHRILSVRSAKFKRKIEPDEEIDVALVSRVEAGEVRVKATFKVGDEVAALVSLVAKRMDGSAQ